MVNSFKKSCIQLEIERNWNRISEEKSLSVFPRNDLIRPIQTVLHDLYCKMKCLAHMFSQTNLNKLQC